MDVVLKLSFHTGIDEGRVPDLVCRTFQEGRIEHAEIQKPVADSSVQFGDDRIVRPRLEPEEHPVLQLHHPDRVERGRRMVVEDIVVERLAYIVRDLVLVAFPEH